MSAFTSIRTWFAGRTNAFKAAVATAWQTFIGVFALSLVGFIADVQEWAGSVEGSFPSVSPLGKAFVSAVAATASALVAYVVRSAQQAKDPTAGPTYEK